MKVQYLKTDFLGKDSKKIEQNEFLWVGVCPTYPFLNTFLNMVYLALMTSSSLANLLHSSSASDTIFATLNEHVMNMMLDAGVSILRYFSIVKVKTNSLFGEAINSEKNISL